MSLHGINGANCKSDKDKTLVSKTQAVCGLVHCTDTHSPFQLSHKTKKTVVWIIKCEKLLKEAHN